MNNSHYNELTPTQRHYVDSIRTIGKQWGYDLTKTNWTRGELVAVSMKRQGNDDVPNWIVKDQSRRVSRGVYAIPEIPLEATSDVQSVSHGHGNDGDDLSDMVAPDDPRIEVVPMDVPLGDIAVTITGEG